jgi:hypothetical protein
MSVPLNPHCTLGRVESRASRPSWALKRDGGTADKSASGKSQVVGLIKGIDGDGFTEGSDACLARRQL